MHNHADRDKFININYDLMSIMHYDRKAFSKNGLDTMAPKDVKFLNKIGHRRGMTKGDAKRINNMYGCKIHII